MASQLTNENVLNELLRHVPEFEGSYLSFIKEFGEAINYPLFAKLVRFTKQTFMTLPEQNEQAEDVLKRIFEFVEMCATSTDIEIVTLAQMGFLESLHLTEEFYEQTIQHLLPQSQKLFAEIEEWWNRPSQNN